MHIERWIFFLSCTEAVENKGSVVVALPMCSHGRNRGGKDVKRLGSSLALSVAKERSRRFFNLWDEVAGELSLDTGVCFVITTSLRQGTQPFWSKDNSLISIYWVPGTETNLYSEWICLDNLNAPFGSVSLQTNSHGQGQNQNHRKRESFSCLSRPCIYLPASPARLPSRSIPIQAYEMLKN